MEPTEKQMLYRHLLRAALKKDRVLVHEAIEKIQDSIDEHDYRPNIQLLGTVIQYAEKEDYKSIVEYLLDNSLLIGV